MNAIGNFVDNKAHDLQSKKLRFDTFNQILIAFETISGAILFTNEKARKVFNLPDVGGNIKGTVVDSTSYDRRISSGAIDFEILYDNENYTVCRIEKYGDISILRSSNNLNTVDFTFMAFDKMFCPYILFDESFIIMDSHASLQKHLDVKSSGLVGRSFIDLFSFDTPDDRKAFIDKFQNKSWNSKVSFNDFLATRTNSEKFRIFIREIEWLNNETVYICGMLYNDGNVKETGLIPFLDRIAFIEIVDADYIDFAFRLYKPLIVAYLNVDGFQAITETYGAHAASVLILQLIQRLENVCEEMGTTTKVVYLGGDEFAITAMMVNIDESAIETGERLCKKINEALSIPFQIFDDEIFISCCVGISRFPDDGNKADVLFNNADTAMHLAKIEKKKTGVSRHRFYVRDHAEHIRRRYRISSELKKSLQDNDFVTYFQPQFYGKTGRCFGVESLIRWRNPKTGVMVSPADFIPVAEETGLIIPIGRWILDQACVQGKVWFDAGSPLSVAVNISPIHAALDSFVDDVRSALARSGLPPELLEIEIVESGMISMDQGSRNLLDLKKMGVRIALDDFGTGYSSLSYIQTLPLDLIKIDQSFVRRLPNAVDESMIKAIVALSVSMNKEVLAEGVETEEQRQILLAAGVSKMQGFLFGRPSPTPFG